MNSHRLAARAGCPASGSTTPGTPMNSLLAAAGVPDHIRAAWWATPWR